MNTLKLEHGSSSSIEAATAILEVAKGVGSGEGRSCPGEAAQRLRLALRVSGLQHTYSAAQVVGVYPA